MSGTLTVHVNRGGTNSVTTERSAYRTSGPFDVVLENHGTPVHVHVHLDDALSRVASLDAPNHYLEGGKTRPLRVHVDPGDEPVTGRLEVTAGYGAEGDSVEVTVEAPDGDADSVRVDESLGERQPPADDGPALPDADALVPPLVVAVGVLLTAVGFLALDGAVAVFVAVVALLGGASAAVFLYRRG